MLYHLLVPLAKDNIVFNVFRYLTFRTVDGDGHRAGDLASCWGRGSSTGCGSMQHGESTIREDTPERHQKTKKGTPTMGGIVHPGRHPRLDAAVGEPRATATCGW